MLPTKRRRDDREPLPRQRGGEEHLPNDSMWSLGTLEPTGEQLVRWPATWLHIVALQERIVYLPSGADPAATFGHHWTPCRGQGEPLCILTKILLKRLQRSNTLSCGGRLAPMRTRRRTGRWKEKSPLPASQDHRPEAVLPQRPAAPTRTKGAPRKTGFAFPS